jgi:hypothetical protein
MWKEEVMSYFKVLSQHKAFKYQAGLVTCIIFIAATPNNGAVTTNLTSTLYQHGVAILPIYRV